MGREVRMVPRGWEHPRDESGRHVALHSDYTKTLEEEAAWGVGYVWDYSTGDFKLDVDGDIQKYESFEEYGGTVDRDDYMPPFPPSICTHLQMYETCSEGTPISPVMETPEELARWLADNDASAFGNMTATYEQWLATCSSGWAPSAVFSCATGLESGVAAMGIKEESDVT